MYSDKMQTIVNEIFTAEELQTLEALDYDQVWTHLEEMKKEDKLTAYVEAEVKSDWKLDEMREIIATDGEAKEFDEYEDDPEDTEETICLYAGSSLNIYPSGKYYLPFAHSNVNALEAIIDEIYFQTLEQELDARGIWIESGEGDPLDQFYCIRQEKTTDDDDEEEGSATNDK